MRLRDVRYRPIADIDLCSANVCFRGQSGHELMHRPRLHLTQSRHPPAPRVALAKLVSAPIKVIV